MNNIFENIKKVEALAEICQKDARQYIGMHQVGAEQWELDAFLPRMDDNNHHFSEVVRQLSLDTPTKMLNFIKCIKALGAVEALESVKDSGNLSPEVNSDLESLINYITEGVTSEH